MKKRPFGVTLLAILAGVLAAFAILRAIQFTGLIPFFVTQWDIPVRGISWFSALMYGLLAWVYIWLVQMLWRVDPQAWLFLAVITVFNLVMDFVIVITGTPFSEIAWSVVLNALILIYMMLPGVKKSFGTGERAL